MKGPETGSRRRRLPPWLTKRIPTRGRDSEVRAVLEELGLETVCRGAHCPNQCECYSEGTATFMVLGSRCTRRCTFCAVQHAAAPGAPDPDEPARVAEAAARLGLRHVVVTSVTRDDLADGGAGHFARVVEALRAAGDFTIEVLTPDFGGAGESIDRVARARPEVYNHNVETVPRLYPQVRPGADYGRSLELLRRVARRWPSSIPKTGFMLGLGETDDEVVGLLGELRAAGVRIVTVGQYLAPSPDHHPVVEFVEPERFERWREAALGMGFEAAACGPFVRSSYHAGESYRACAADT